MFVALLLFWLASPALASDYTRHFERYWEMYFLDVPQLQWPLAESVAWAESSFNPDAVSPVGAKGLLQIMDETFAEIQGQVPSIREHSPFDPEVSISAGCYYLKRCWSFWTVDRTPEERAKFMLASYNAGPGNVDKAWQKAIDWGTDGSWQHTAEALPSITGQANARQTTGYVAKIWPRYQRRVHELGLHALADGTRVALELTRFDKLSDQTQPVAFTPPALPEEEPVEQAIAAMGVSSLFELLGHNYGYKLALLTIAILVGVFVPPWAFEKFDKKLKYDTAEAIKAGHRWPAILACVQVTGIFAVIITGLLLLH